MATQHKTQTVCKGLIDNVDMTHSGTRRPILILSLPRAGSTWTVNVLSQSAGVLLVSEPADAYLWPAALWAKFGLAEYPTPDDAIASTRFQSLWATVLNNPYYFNPTRLSANLLPRIHSSLIRSAIKPRPSALAPSRGRVKNVKRLGRQTRSERLLIKEVTVPFCGGVIADWLDAEVLVIRRDPEKVAASWQKMDFPPEPVHHQPWVAREIIQALDIAKPSLTSHAERLAWTVGLLDLALLREAQVRQWPPQCEFREIVRIFGLESTDEMWRFLEDSGKSEGSGYSTSRTAEQIRDSSKGVFSVGDQAKIKKVLSLLAVHLPSNST